MYIFGFRAKRTPDDFLDIGLVEARTNPLCAHFLCINGMVLNRVVMGKLPVIGFTVTGQQPVLVVIDCTVFGTLCFNKLANTAGDNINRQTVEIADIRVFYPAITPPVVNISSKFLILMIDEFRKQFLDAFTPGQENIRPGIIILYDGLVLWLSG